MFVGVGVWGGTGCEVEQDFRVAGTLRSLEEVRTVKLEVRDGTDNWCSVTWTVK